MAKTRDTYRYELRDGRKIVDIGITDDPERREQQHRSEGHCFGNMTLVGPRVTEDSARDWEQDRLETYRSGHQGRLPRYNKIGGKGGT